MSFYTRYSLNFEIFCTHNDIVQVLTILKSTLGKLHELQYLALQFTNNTGMCKIVK